MRGERSAEAGGSKVLARVETALRYVKARYPETPQLVLTLGSGLASLADILEDALALDYAEIPGFVPSTAPGHAGRLWLGRLHHVPIAIYQGRFHRYEGLAMEQVVLPVRVMAAWGVPRIFLSNAAGSLNPDYAPVSLMRITDHISLFCESPLRGPNLDSFGPRFPDQTQVYDPQEAERLDGAAEELGLVLHQGVYCYTQGPAYETPAEIRLLRQLGADAVGMSTVPEAQVASHAGMRVLGVSCLSNWAAGIGGEALDETEVLEAGKSVTQDLTRLVSAYVSRL